MEISKPVPVHQPIGSYCQTEFLGDFDEKFELEAHYYKLQPIKAVCYYCGVICTGGILYILQRWILKLQLMLIYQPCDFKEATNVIVKKAKNNIELADDKLIVLTNGYIHDKQVKYFIYEYLTFYIECETQTLQFLSHTYEHLSNVAILRKVNGLTMEESKKQMEYYGQNIMDVEIKPYYLLLIDEILTPFNLFQFFAIALWAYDDYLIYAMLLLILTIIQIVDSLHSLRSSLLKIRRMITFISDVVIIRDGLEVTMKSNEIVPGDVFLLNNFSKIPCDCILINGSCTANEAILTGESIPINKVSLVPLNANFVPKQNESSMLYSGTQCLRSNNALALAYKTGFATNKGSLARSIIFTRNTTFSFERDSRRYLVALFILGILFAGFSFYLAYLWEADVETQIIDALEILTVIICPTLPTALAAGISLAVGRLKRKNIECIKPDKVNVAAKINICAFDKTGTLTELGLDVLGCRPAKHKGFTKQQQLIHSEGEFQECLVSCHSLVMDGTLQGDPIDLSMFIATGWSYSDGKGLGIMSKEDKEIVLVERFEFVAELQRMSVVSKIGDNHKLFCKGSPEAIKSLCIAETVPENFHTILQLYTIQGLRVIGCAFKELTKIGELRGEYEKDLRFLGFLIFENKLKPETTGIIKILQEARLKTVMVTGDIAFTGVNIAIQCGIMKSDKRILMGQMQGESLEWVEVEQQQNQLEDEQSYYSLHQLDNKVTSSEQICKDDQLVLTGGAFEHLAIRFASDQAHIAQLLIQTLVYARMKPNNKGDLMTLLQKRPNTYVSFCGDGTNDTCALRTADVGLALSSEDASLAAPFSSNITNISGMVTLLIEGRASLVTSIECFKFLTMYAIIQTVAMMLCYSQNSDLTMWQYMYQDLFLILPFAITMDLTKGHDHLAKFRPCSDLLSFPVLSSIVMQCVISVVSQVLCYLLLREQQFYIDDQTEYEEDTSDMHNTLFIVISSAQVIGVAIAYTQGPPFREYLFKNIAFVVWCSLAIIIQILFTLYLDYYVFQELDMAISFPEYFREWLLGISIGIVVVNILYEKIFTNLFTQRYSLREAV